MTVEQAISQISSLSIDEQIRVLTTVWDRMPMGTAESLSPEQTAEFERRLAKHREDPGSSMTEADLRKRLRDARS